MWKIVLVDDEKVVLRGIAAALKKEDEYELAATASDGVEGLEIIRKVRPDIVLTDIRMPGISGLEMIRESKKTLPDTVYIVFSGFNEFKYVKEAIGLGVIDYIEKPVTLPKLKEVLRKASEMRKFQENYTAMTNEARENERTIIEKSLRDLYERPASEEDIIKDILTHNPRLSASSDMCAMRIQTEEGQSVDDFRTIIQRMTFGMVGRAAVCFYSFYVRDSLMLVYFNMGDEDIPFLNLARESKAGLSEEGLSILAGISRTHKSIYELRAAFDEADNALRYANYLEAEELVYIENVEYAHAIPYEISHDHKSLEFDFRLGQFDECRRQIAEYVDYLWNLDLLPELFIHKCLDLVFLMQRLLIETGVQEDFDADLKYSEIRDITSGEKIREWTIERTEELIQKAENQSGRTNRAITMVKRYIDEHYQEGLSLDELAERAHMSSTYLSMLFKKEEGITYIRYLTRIRMEKAMEFLKAGYKAKDVCEMVGYHDYKYFSTQFKTATGMTLDNFKRSC